MRISIAAARVNKKLTQEQFAKEVGVSKSTVQKWEKGKSKPSFEKIEPICNVLEMSYDDINWQG